MSRKTNLTPHEHVRERGSGIVNRYLEESDLEEGTMAEIMQHVLGQWMDEDVVDFSSDIDLEDDG